MKKISILILFLGAQLTFSQTLQQEEQKPAQLLSEAKVNDTLYIPAEFPGGLSALRSYIAKEIKTSKFSDTPGTYRSVTTFDVNPDGSISSVSTTGNSPAFNEEVSRVMKKLKTKWIPATKNGQPIKFKVRMPLGWEI